MDNKHLVFEGIHFRVYQQSVEVNPGVFQTHETVWRRDGTRVLALDADQRLLLAREYRYELHDYDWRIPGGKLAAENESPEDAAAREFEEETGLRPRSLRHLRTTTPFATVDYRIHFFLATEFLPGDRALEIGEHIQLSWLPLQEAVELAFRGDIAEDISALAVIRLAHFQPPKVQTS